MDVLKIKEPYKSKRTRILFQIEKDPVLPSVVFFGGIHGNEKAGVKALKKVQKNLKEGVIKGNIYGVLGNLMALELNQRYVDEDLNRLWTSEKIDQILSKTVLNSEEKELKELLQLLHRILKTNKGPFYFIDLHTTSSKTLPFITINDALINRAFSKLFPVPIVLGIEEYLEGPLLSYINSLGYVSIGFESGQHTDIAAIKNNIAFIYLVLFFTNVLNKEDINNENHFETLKLASNSSDRFYEIVYLYKIKSKDSFKMKEGFKSFQAIERGEQLAITNNIEITSNYKGYIFMPLYQCKGNEGFFIIKPIIPFFLYLSRVLRYLKADRLLIGLFGIYWQNKKAGILKVNLRVAKFLAKPIFHLLGYRNKLITENYMFLYNRESVAKKEMYKNTKWF